jgi:non-ribosomal peptide synthase protein (TIGR01720 family)
MALLSERRNLPRLNTTVSSLPTVEIKIATAVTAPSAARSRESMEERMLKAVSQVLQLPRDEIQLFDSFSDLGGDLLTAACLRESCMMDGIRLKVDDILRCHTLAELQTCIKPCEDDEQDADKGESFQDESINGSSSPSDVFSTTLRSSSDNESISTRSHRTASSQGSRVAIELEITENALLLAPQVLNAAVIRPKAGYFEDKIVAFMTLKNGAPQETDSTEVKLIPQSQVNFAGTQVAALRMLLESPAQACTVPAVWIVLASMPLVDSAVDKRQLQTWIQNINDDLYQQVMSLESQELLQEPMSDVEQTIRQLVSRVLRIPKEQVGMNFSFRQLGGDDISAIELVAACRAESILTKPEDVLRSASLAQVAFLASWKGGLGTKWTEESMEGFKLSPMQQLYFQTSMGGDMERRARSDGSYRFNQSVLLRIRSGATLEDVHAALETVVGHHSMLRSRFRYGPDGWTQRILPEARESYTFGHHRVSNNDGVLTAIAQSQASINIENGPVFAVAHFLTNDGQQLIYIAAHHLVVDLISWRIIIHDLDELLQHGSLFSDRCMPFQRWNELQEDVILNTQDSDFLPFLPPPADYDYWGLEGKPNTYGDALEVSFSLSVELTSILHTTCSEAFRTDIADIYLAALILSFCQTFPDRAAPAIWNQEHGREAWCQEIDIAATVGWFTSLCPVWLGVDVTEDFVHVLRRMKDTRRSIPRRGWMYFASRFFNQNQAGNDESQDWPLEIMFTYAGSVQHLERQNGLLENLTIPGRTLASATSDIGPNVGRIALFEVSAMVDQGAAKVKFLYNRNSGHQELITSWIQNYEHLLLEAIGRLRYRSQELTLADVPDLNTSYEGLARLNTERLETLGLSSSRDIESVYPVTALQQGFLVSQLQRAESCQRHTIFELTRQNKSQIDQAQLCTAWESTVAKHPVLRTVFIESVSEDGVFDQVVLRKLSPKMLFIDVAAGEDPLDALNNLPLLRPRSSEARHRLSLCRADRSTYLKLEISQALCDVS